MESIYINRVSYTPEVFVVALHYTYVVRLIHICTDVLFRARSVVSHPEIS